MKILYTSDVHIDYSAKNRKVLNHLNEKVIKENPDLIIITGDLANTLEEVQFGLSQFSGWNR